MILALCALDSWPVHVFTRAHLDLLPKRGDIYTSLSFIMRQFALVVALVVYVALHEKIHFGDRLNVEIAVSPVAAALELPMPLPPLIETSSNAANHRGHLEDPNLSKSPR